VADAAVQWNGWMEDFLRQRTDEWCSPDETYQLLTEVAQA
jgi:type III secretion protein N (ATPase)